jgi:hypothetical protein
LANFLGGLLEQRLISAVDHERDSSLGQRLGATSTQTLARCTDDGGSPADA